MSTPDEKVEEELLSLVSDEGEIKIAPPKAPEVQPEQPQHVRDLISQAVETSPKEEAKVIAGITKFKRAKEHFVGLSKIQRKFLLNRALTETDAEACRLAGVNVPTMARWKRTNGVFMQAYAALWVDTADFTEAMLNTLLPKSIIVLEEAMDSPKERLKAVDILFRSRGMLKPEKTEVESALERALALQLLERGQSIPPGLRKYLEADNSNSDINSDISVEPGEYRELDGMEGMDGMDLDFT